MKAALTVGSVMAVGVALGFWQGAIPDWITRALDPSLRSGVPVLTIRTGNVRLIMPVDGELVGLETTPIEVPRVRGGSLKVSWLLEEGSLVEPGDLVVRFDETDARISLEESENRVLRYGIQIDEGRATAESEDRRLDLDQLQADLELGYADEQVLQDVQVFSLWEIKESVVSAALARYRKETLDRKRGLQDTRTDASIRILEIDRQDSAGNMEIAKETLSRLELAAPAPGILLYRSRRFDKLDVGTEVWSGEHLLDLANVQEFRAVVDVPEQNIAGIQRGTPAAIQLEAFPGQRLHATVSRISRVAKQLTRRDPRQYFVVDLSVMIPVDLVNSLKPGLALTASLEIGYWETGVAVPKSAVVETETGHAVYWLTEDGFNRKEVRIVGSDHGFHVIEGLESGQVVALRDPTKNVQLSLPDFNAPAASSTRGRRFVFE